MRKKQSRFGYVMRKSAMLLLKKGPIGFIRYIKSGVYNHRYLFSMAVSNVSSWSFAIKKMFFSGGPSASLRRLWLLLFSPSYRQEHKFSEEYEQFLRIKRFFPEYPIMADVASDLMLSRRTNRVWVQENSKARFKVLFITSIGETLSARYQVDNLCEQLQKQDVQASILYDFEIAKHLEKALTFDVLVFQRLPLAPDIGRLLALGRERNIALVFEIDDYIFDMPILLSQDSIKRSSPADIALFAKLSEHMRETLLACDYFIGTTATLAKAAADLNRVSFVIRNGVSDRQVNVAKHALQRRSSWQKANGLIRIGYQPGTRTHRQNFAVALPGVIRILEAFPQVNLVIQGLLEMPEALRPFYNRVEQWPYVPWKKLVDVTARLDIAIAPLEPNNPYNESKSALKYFESGLVEVPVVASPTEDFRTAIRHGVNGFLASSEDEWYESLKVMIEGRLLRRQVGIAAREDVLTHYTSMAQSSTTLAVFQTILREHALRQGQ